MPSVNILIKNGIVMDGQGNPWFHADVAIEGKKISRIGVQSGVAADRIIDAQGMAVAPGFVDIHNHSDVPLLVSGRAESMVRQGVTTMLTCNCGSSPFPLFGEALERAKKEYRSQYDLDVDWSSIEKYEDRLRRQGISINEGLQVGHGNLRGLVMGYENRAATGRELNEMKQLVADHMEAGCFGMSTGMGYSPGMFADSQEIIELCKVVAKYGGIYTTHVRAAYTFPRNLEEALEIGEKAGLPVEMAHIGSSTCQRNNWGRARSVTLNIVEAARARGVDFTADLYPYTVSGGGLSMYVPQWAQEGGTSKMLERLSDPSIRKKIREDEELQRILLTRDWSQLLIYHLSNPENKVYEGKTVSEIAKMRGMEPFDAACDLLIEENGHVGFMGFFGLEEDVRTLMKHEAVMIGSDGSALQPTGVLGRGNAHPRNYGTFARVIETYVGGGVLSLPEAVHKMSGMPAWRLGLNDRGIIRPGAYADIVIFNPSLVKEKYNLTAPRGFPDGIPYVIVNGVVTVDQGTHTGAMSGEILHRPSHSFFQMTDYGTDNKSGKWPVFL